MPIARVSGEQRFKNSFTSSGSAIFLFSIGTPLSRRSSSPISASTGTSKYFATLCTWLTIAAFSFTGFVEPSIITLVKPSLSASIQIGKPSPWSRWIDTGTSTLSAHHFAVSTNQSCPE